MNRGSCDSGVGSVVVFGGSMVSDGHFAMTAILYKPSWCGHRVFGMVVPICGVRSVLPHFGQANM